MSKILKFIDEWGVRITFILVLIVFLKTCTTNNKIEKVEKIVTQKSTHIDSVLVNISEKTISKDELIDIVKNTPNWKTLELEELSDKNRIPINKLKNDNEK